ncbi:MAG: 50S ribosomal protein L35 [Armatimonadota bacterium]|nr:50S ribosomal protein L35 [Armatimonadota bacterium]MCX7776548.1 50S ribosomal protein L35 [Armatimonadota bacterium]MDW8024347.1 50S ribosomal protein L35 [Armatimonadota bacterium]
MPGKKSKRTAKKRFKVTATGKVMHVRMGGGHYMRRKCKRRKRLLKKETTVYPGQVKAIKELLSP